MKSLCLINLALRPERTSGREGIAPPFSAVSALDGGERSASRLGRFNPGEIASGIHSIRGWMKPQSLSGCCKDKNARPVRSSSLHRLRYPNPHPTTVSWFSSKRWVLRLDLWFSQQCLWRILSSVARWKPADVSKEHIASIFLVE
jgi:hypothetical protein